MTVWIFNKKVDARDRSSHAILRSAPTQLQTYFQQMSSEDSSTGFPMCFEEMTWDLGFYFNFFLSTGSALYLL